MTALRVGVTALVVATLLSVLCSECVDALYMLASGRWMSANGAIQVENVASAAPGMRIVVQNWLLCVVYWHVYELGLSLGVGFLAVRIAHMASMAALFLLVWRMARAVSPHPATPWVALGMTTLGYSLPDIRVHALATLAMVFCMWVADQVMEGRRPTQWLLLIPLVCVIHANMQSTLAVFDALMAMAVAFASLPARERRGRFLLAMGATVLGCLGCLATPYGIDGILYVGSIGGLSDVSDMFGVWELLPLPDLVRMGHSLAMIPCATTAFLALALSSLSAVRHGRRRLLIPCLLTGGFLVTAFFASRMLLQANAAAVFLTMLAADDVARDLRSAWWDGSTPSRRGALAVTVLLGACSAVPVGVSHAWRGLCEVDSLRTGVGIEPVTLFHDSETTPWSWAGLIGEGSQNVLCSPNAGSYMEFLGHKVTVSSRWEAWTEPCDVSPNIFRDTIATMRQRDAGEDVEGLVGGVSRIEWDYAFISPVRDAAICDWLARQPDWEEVPQDPIVDDWEPYVPRDGQPGRDLDDELPYRIWMHVPQGGDGTGLQTEDA